MPDAPRKRGRRAPKAQVSAPETSESQPLQSKPQKMNQGGFTGLSVPDAKAEAICLAHARGTSTKRICQELGVSHHTVAAVIRNRPEMLERAREFTRMNWQTIAAMGTAELIDRVPTMKDQGLAVLSAIATEKAELLSGNATQRVEHVAAPAADEWQAILAAMKKAQGNTKTTEIPAIEAESYTVEADGIGVEMGKAAALPEPKQPADAPQIAPQTPADGLQPLDSSTADREQAATVSSLVSDEAQNVEACPPGTPTGAGAIGGFHIQKDPFTSSDREIFQKKTND